MRDVPGTMTNVPVAAGACAPQHPPAGFATLCCLLVAALALPARADQLVLKNGKKITGEVSAEDDRSVTLEVAAPGMTFTQRVKKTDIETWSRRARVGPPYVLVPILGEIGRETTAALLKDALDKAREAKPKYIVLVIDSPGGNVAEMARMIDALDEAAKGVEVVSYVEHAYSAAAVIAMSRPQLFMKPDAAIGAAVPYKMTKDGPADLEAKFRSPIEAEFRRAAAHAGHAELLVRGMVELDLDIFLAQENGKPVLRTVGPGKVIKSKGHILTLTTDEAVACGLAHVATDIAHVGKQVAGGPWYEASRRAWDMVVAAVEQEHHQVARQQAIARIKPEWDAIQRRIAELVSKYGAALSTLDNLKEQYDSELRKIDAEYRQAVEVAQSHADSKAMAYAAQVRNARAAELREKFQTTAATLVTGGEAARLEYQQLSERQKQLLASIPYQ